MEFRNTLKTTPTNSSALMKLKHDLTSPIRGKLFVENAYLVNLSSIGAACLFINFSVRLSEIL